MVIVIECENEDCDNDGYYASQLVEIKDLFSFHFKSWHSSDGWNNYDAVVRAGVCVGFYS